MEAQTKTLRDIKLHQDITLVLEPYLPENFINAVFNHMKNNEEDLYDHTYLRDSLFVAQRLINAEKAISEHDKRLVYAIIALMETGHPLTRDYPYEASPGVGWMYLRLYANTVFNREEERFITQSCRPLKPQTLKPSVRLRVQLIVHNTQRLTDVVNQRYEKLYKTFVEDHNRLASPEDIKRLFLEHYGRGGNLWRTVSDSAMAVFATDIDLFKREVGSAIGDH